MPLNGNLGGSQSFDHRRIGRIEVTHQPMRGNAHGIQPIGASVGGDDQIGIGQLVPVS
jgi:hypothetical protein